jgi:hypothetical protein
MYGGIERCMYGADRESWKTKGYLEDLGIGGRIILKYMFRKWNVLVQIAFIGLRIRTNGELS